MADREFDVLVIGGGIHGVGVAQAAAAAGFRAGLLEQGQLACGTSSRSSKLIHGGLRYLESFEFGLVRESLLERELLLRLAPTLVHRQDFFIPVYRRTRRRPWTIRMGLTLYSVLAGFGPAVRFRTVPRNEWNGLDGLSTEGLQVVFQFSDAQTDDAMLTQAVMGSAQSLGAELLCPATFVSAERKDVHYEFQYRSGDQLLSGTARVLVNAAGPWANRILATITPRQPAFRVELVQGTHLELPGTIDRGCYYMEMPDRRAVFVMPWKGRTLVGTTEHVYDGDPALVTPLQVESDYLLDGFRACFPGRNTEILDAWAGLRVLPAADEAAFRRSRETQLPVDCPRQPRLISIFGGKLTGYRATAKKVMEKIMPSLPSTSPIADTAELKLE